MARMQTSLHLRDALGHVLRHQHLDPQVQSKDVVRVVDDLVGLHATLATTPYLSLFTRVLGFRRTWLERELYETRTLARIRSMRKTIFIVSRSALAPVFAGTSHAIEASRRRYLASGGVSIEACDRLAPRIVEVLRGCELTVTQIKTALGTQADVSSVTGLLCDDGVLIRTRPAGGWRDMVNTYALLHEWLPDIDLRKVPEQEAVTWLVRAYVDAYGPVTERDIAWWAGLPMTSVRSSLAALASDLIRVDVSGLAGSFLMLRSEAAASAGAAVADGSVLALLPALDPYVMGYKERSRLVNADLVDRVFDRAGNATSTILLDGRLIGVWDAVEQPTPTIRLHLFTPGSDDLLARLHERARRVGAFLFEHDAQAQLYMHMNPLTSRPLGAYFSPLKDVTDGHAL